MAAEQTLRMAYLREVNNSANVQVRSEQIGRLEDRDLPAGGFDRTFKLKPDILDKDLKKFYEIKSTFPSSIAAGLRELRDYDAALKKRFPDEIYTRGQWMPQQLSYLLEVPGWIEGFPLPIVIHARLEAPGLIVYNEMDVTQYAMVAGVVGLLLPDLAPHLQEALKLGGRLLPELVGPLGRPPIPIHAPIPVGFIGILGVGGFAF